ncbi:hypothetical protein LTR22_026716 [Elasticomyces elasticus]|nr:hypothetical protein LTR22_026716 [Elasticomyces elasticus]
MDSTSRDACQISRHEFPEADKVQRKSAAGRKQVRWDHHIAELFSTFVKTEQTVTDEALRQRVSETYESRVETRFVVAPKLVCSSRGRMAVEADDSDLDSADSTVKAARMPFGACGEQTRVSVKVGTCRDLVPSPSYATDMVPASGNTITTSTTRHIHAYGDGHESFHEGGVASHFQTDVSNTSNALEAPLQNRMRASATDGSRGGLNVVDNMCRADGYRRPSFSACPGGLSAHDGRGSGQEQQYRKKGTLDIY